MNDTERAGFGEVIRDARKRRGWSQSELGEKAGVSRPTVARVEANNDVTTTVAEISQALGLTLKLKDRG